VNAAGLPAAPVRQLEGGLSFQGAEALIEEARRRQRRRWRRRAILGAGLGLLAGVIAGVSLSGGTGRQPGEAGLAPAGAPAVMPARIVVWTGTFRIEVLSSRTGRLIRTLATDVALYRGVPTLAVSAAGVVYFDDAGGGSQWVRSVSLAGGAVTTIAAGTSPAISPDGRLLAYVTGAGQACSRPCAAGPEAIVVRDLAAGTQKTWALTSALTDITSLCWSPDGRQLAFAGTTEARNGTVTVRTAQVLDTRAGGTLDRARPIPLGQAVAWAGYLTASTGVGITVGPDGVIQAGSGLVEVAVRGGQVIRRLTSLPPHGLGTGNAFDGAEHAIAVDRAGRFILIAGAGAGTGEIFRWTARMRRPVRIASGALVAVWAG